MLLGFAAVHKGLIKGQIRHTAVSPASLRFVTHRIVTRLTGARALLPIEVLLGQEQSQRREFDEILDIEAMFAALEVAERWGPSGTIRSHCSMGAFIEGGG